MLPVGLLSQQCWPVLVPSPWPRGTTEAISTLMEGGGVGASRSSRHGVHAEKGKSFSFFKFFFPFFSCNHWCEVKLCLVLVPSQIVLAAVGIAGCCLWPPLSRWALGMAVRESTTLSHCPIILSLHENFFPGLSRGGSSCKSPLPGASWVALLKHILGSKLFEQALRDYFFF